MSARKVIIALGVVTVVLLAIAISLPALLTSRHASPPPAAVEPPPGYPPDEPAPVPDPSEVEPPYPPTDPNYPPIDPAPPPLQGSPPPAQGEPSPLDPEIEQAGDAVFLPIPPTGPFDPQGPNWTLASEGLRIPQAQFPQRSLTWLHAMRTEEEKEKESLAPQTAYRFELVLSALSKPITGVRQHPVSTELKRTLLESAAKGEPLTLQSVLLTNPDALRLAEGENADKQFKIDVHKLARAPAPVAEDAIEETISDELGKVIYRLRSGNKQGWTYVAVVLIKDNRALDQIIARYCLGECAGPQPSGRVPGQDTLAALLSSTAEADAALFLTELEERRLHGVLVLTQPINGRRVWVWSTTRSGENFRHYLTATVVSHFQALDTRATLVRKGEDLADVLFESNADSAAARKALGEFAARNRPRPGDDASPPKLFVKFDFPSNGEGPTYIPLGLLVVDLAPGKPDFLGRHVAIEQPLEHPRYGTYSACPSSFVALFPGENVGNKELLVARRAMLRRSLAWEEGERVTVHRNSSTFRDWLREERDRGPTSLLVLSHHDSQRFFFSSADPGVPSSSVRSRYGSPSVAILNGCGTGKPGAVDFVRRFNAQGFESVIVSSFDVHPAVAGAYAGCFRQFAKSDNLPLRDVHFLAVNSCKWGAEDPPMLEQGELAEALTVEVYAANALKYMLLGNSDLPICPLPLRTIEG